MPNINIVSGPPGVGKSTFGQLFIGPHLPIVKKDEIIAEQKSFNYQLYEHVAISKFLNRVNEELSNERDIALELTMGKLHHYEFATQLKRDYPATRLNLILFFTDDLEQCKQRASARFKDGGHEVKPEMLEMIYNSTLPLLKNHFSAIDKLTLVDVATNGKPELIGTFDRDKRVLSSSPNKASWFNEQLRPFLQRQILGANYAR